MFKRRHKDIFAKRRLKGILKTSLSRLKSILNFRVVWIINFWMVYISFFYELIGHWWLQADILVINAQ